MLMKSTERHAMKLQICEMLSGVPARAPCFDAAWYCCWVAKATVMISAATMEHESDVDLSHLLPASTSSLWDSLKTSIGVSLLL